MMHELDFQRVTGRLEGYQAARIEHRDRVRKFKLALFWILTGALTGTLFGIGYILTERAHF